MEDDLLTPNGRLPRAPFFAYSIVIAILGYMLSFFMVLKGSMEGNVLLSIPLIFIGAGWLGFAAYMTVLMTIKRLHDFEFSGWHTTWIMAPSILGFFIDHPSILDQILFMLSLITTCWLVLMPGTRGPNKYGEQD